MQSTTSWRKVADKLEEDESAAKLERVDKMDVFSVSSALLLRTVARTSPIASEPHMAACKPSVRILMYKTLEQHDMYAIHDKLLHTCEVAIEKRRTVCIEVTRLCVENCICDFERLEAGKQLQMEKVMLVLSALRLGLVKSNLRSRRRLW
jgi:hypothetical protein